jgi:N-acetylmuramoyl-L-alanine amidase
LIKLFLDAGHGGKDFGAFTNNTIEKDIVLNLAKKTQMYLTANFKNIEIRLSRTNDAFISLDERTNQANSWGADAFVSFHINSNPDSNPRGFETHIYPDVGADTISFQNVMHEEIWKKISGTTGVIDRGKKRSNFHVLRESNMKAILTENFFLSNPLDAALIKSDAFLNKLAVGHSFGLEKFFGLERIRPPSSNSLYQVIAGTYEDFDNAQAQLERLKKDGYSAYIVEKE